jgi:hypothetical protein
MRSPLCNLASRRARSSAVVVVLVAGAVLSGCSGHGRRAAASTIAPAGSTTTRAKAQDAPSSKARCPLTDLAAPGGQVPQRQALAVKVDNLPSGARPQYGLDSADVVYEEPVEGGITRLIAIFQCDAPSRVEPVRSGRIIDPEILEQYGAHPLIAYSGGIAPAVSAIDSSSLIDVSIDRASGAYSRDPGRYSPHNLAVDTIALWAAGTSMGAPSKAPKAVFHFGKLDSLASPAASVEIGYTYPGSAAQWSWNPSAGLWERSYPGYGTAYNADGSPIQAVNVIVMSVEMYPSQYVEDATGTHENLLTLTGSGPVEVFRNNAVIRGSWKRNSLSDVTSYLDANGHAINLAPGNTWIELVPTTVATTVSP